MHSPISIDLNDSFAANIPIWRRSWPKRSLMPRACLRNIRSLVGPIAGRDEYRQMVLRVLNASYIFQYRYDGARLVMLRVFHSREQR